MLVRICRAACCCVTSLALSLVMVAGLPLVSDASGAHIAQAAAASTIAQVRALIEQLPAPAAVVEEDGPAIQQARTAYDSLSAAEQKQLDTETNREALHTTQSYGRVLELAEAGYAVLHEVDDSTSLADGIYTTTVTSTWNRGKSASKQDRDWTVARVRVENGKAQMTLVIDSSTYSYVRASGVVAQRLASSAANDSRFVIPVSLNKTMTFIGYSETMAAEIAYNITVSVPDNAVADAQLGSEQDDEGQGGTSSDDPSDAIGAPVVTETDAGDVVVEKGTFAHPEFKGYMFRIVDPAVIVSDGTSMTMRAEMPSSSYGYFCVDSAENASKVDLAAGIESGYFIPAHSEAGSTASYFTFPLKSLDQDIVTCQYSNKNKNWVEHTLRFDSSKLTWLETDDVKAELAQVVDVLENLPARNTIVPDNPEHEATVAAARAAYESLSRAQKAQVPERLKLLLKWDESMFDLGFNTDHLPMAVAGQPYDGAIYVSGKNGESGKSVRVTDGALPNGIGLEMDDAGLWARFTGTPAATGTSTFTVEISNGLEPAVSKQFVIHVGYAPRILTQTLPGAALNSGYACVIEADAYPDATWSFVSGTLPEGLTLQDGGAGSGNAYLLGTPTKAGEFTFTLACDNFANGIEQVEYTIRVEKAQASGADGATQEELKSLENQVASLQAQRKADASKVAKLEMKIKKLQAKLPKEVVINAKKVTAKKVKAALKKANNAGASYVVLGSSVKKISKKAFAGTLVTKLVVKTAKLKKSAVKGCLKGSKVKTVQVKVAKKKLKSVKKSYRKLFVKKVAGKRAKVKFSAA